MRDLPLDREKALDAIASGWGRTATAAHPLCRCGKSYLPSCRLCQAKVGQPCRHLAYDALVLSDLGRARGHGRPEPRPGDRRDCPLHRPEARTR